MNKVMLIGNVGKDPDVRYYDSDQAVAQLRLATTEKGYSLPNGTQVPDRTDWHNLVFYRRLAKVVESYVRKGDKLYIEGRIRYTTYDDKQGQRRYTTEIWADNMEMLTPKGNIAPTTVDSVSQSAQEPRNVPEGETGDSHLPF